MVSTRVLKVDSGIISIAAETGKTDGLYFLSDWQLELERSEDASHLEQAASELRSSAVPVAFPTETVYGLGADATRSDAVQGIYKAKQRPSDNPLIVHVHSLNQLRRLLRPSEEDGETSHTSTTIIGSVPKGDPIPPIYLPLIQKFWPGPLTLIMPNPLESVLAAEVTAGLSTFGVRMPSNKIALALIKLADLPIAAPSANSSSKPSPTTAAHVKNDLEGRISTIIDGGACTVGVESTVVNGLTNPPMILRPGGVALEDLRACPGWGNVQLGYKDAHQSEGKPLAPGMKYRHYSPKAKVILYEADRSQPTVEEMASEGGSIGIVRTKTWKSTISSGVIAEEFLAMKNAHINRWPDSTGGGACGNTVQRAIGRAIKQSVSAGPSGDSINIWEIELGPSIKNIARGIFSALRELDLESVDAIFVEGIRDDDGDIAPAIMNRLRKAAEIMVA